MKKIFYKGKEDAVEREVMTLAEVHELLQKNPGGCAFLDYYDDKGKLIKRIEVKN